MSSRKRAPRPVQRVPSIQQVNQRCKLFLARQCIICTFVISMMTYFLDYEQPNIAARPKILNESDLVIMSYNVRGSNLDIGTTTNWQSRKTVALEMLNMYIPDIIGLQESQMNQLQIFKQLGYNSYGKYMATSILYNKQKFKLIDGDTVWLSKTPHIEHSTSWDMSQERVVTWILITHQISDDNQQCEDTNISQGSYLIFNTHLDHKGEKSRVESCMVIKDIIHEISIIKYENKYPVFITGDFNAAKYSPVWYCFTQNDNDTSFYLIINDSLHDTNRFSYRKKLQLQYTFHNFRGLQMNTWYMRISQYLFYGFSNSVIKYFRHKYFHDVCCMAPSLYKQIYRRREFNRNAGIHHLDWILYGTHDKIETVKYFEVISYHNMVDKSKQNPMKWSLRWLLSDRFVGNTVYPSDHFPIIAGFKFK
eukprot:58371_1